MNNMKCCKNQKGQVIMFVIMAMTIAMAVGVTVAGRSLSSLSRSARSDTANRVIAAAEGGVEKFLTLSTIDLNKVKGGGYCPEGSTILSQSNECLVTFDPNASDNITSQAIVSVDSFGSNADLDGTGYYSFQLRPSIVKEVALDSYSGNSVDICWVTMAASEDSNIKASIYYIVYGKEGQGILKKQIVADPKSTNLDDMPGSVSPSKGGRGPFSNCHEVSWSGTQAYGLRVRALYNPASIGVFPESGKELSDQGYVITSRGELLQEGKVKTTKTVSAYRSHQYLPDVFDTAIYTNGALY